MVFCFGSSSNDELLELPPESPDTNGIRLQSLNLKRYSYADLKSMTMNFSSDTKIGYGWRSAVYTGWVDAETMAPSMYGFGIMVAVKNFINTICCHKELQQELKFLRRLRHPNVLKLLGYCFKDREHLLVYEFMQKGSLDKHLYNTDSSSASICWATRLRIAIGVARGLTFLHSSEVPVVNGGIDPSNILLDRSYNPKISAYREIDPQPRVIFDCLDPEWFITGKLNVKSDVYSFGVVLLEILTGVRAPGGKRSSGNSLVDWAKPLISERANLRTVMDPRLDGQYSIDAAFKAAQLAFKCVRKESQTRPTMKEVLHDLERVERM